MSYHCIQRRVSWFGRLNRDQEGSSLVEFALAVPILMLFLLGSIDAGLYFYLRNSMTTEVRIIARDVALGNLSAADGETQLMTNLDEVADLAYTVDITEPDPSDPSDTNVVVTASVSEASLDSDYALIGLIPFGDINLQLSMRALE